MTATRPPVIRVAGCRKTYGALVALDDVSFAVADGEIFGLIWQGDAWSTHAADIAALIVVFAACVVLSSRVFRWE